MHINDKLVENCGCRKCCINILPSLFINMAVPVSFFHRDKARVDLGWGLTVLLPELWPLVDDLALGHGPVAEAKMRGFVLTEELYFFYSIYWPFSSLQYIIIIFLNRSRKWLNIDSGHKGLFHSWVSLENNVATTGGFETFYSWDWEVDIFQSERRIRRSWLLT